jgi:transposase
MMNQVNPYGSIQKRTFAAALLHHLETEWGLLGGRRILQMLVDDVEALREEFYPAIENVGSGMLIWTCTKDEGRKAKPGKRTEEYKTVTVRLPLVTVEDVADRIEGRTSQTKAAEKVKERDKKRLVRIVKAAVEQGGLLTVAELSVILNRSMEVVRRYAREWEEETGELLALKGYRMDQGSRPTHKREIARLHEEGLEAPDIARASGHSVNSVERYLQDYERVRMLLKRKMSVEDISTAIGRGKRVVLEYVELAREYHPELLEGEN